MSPDIKFKDIPSVPVKELRKIIATQLQVLTVISLKALCGLLSVSLSPEMRKNDLIHAAARALSFPDAGSFRAWYDRFPDISKMILYRLTFQTYVPLFAAEHDYGVKLAFKKSKYYWDAEYTIDPQLGIDFVVLKDFKENPAFCLPPPIRLAFAQWFVPPAEAELAACVLDVSPDESSPDLYNASESISETWPLLNQALIMFLEDVSSDGIGKQIRGMKKKDIQRLRTSSGIASFPVGSDCCSLDSVELLSRFIICMNDAYSRLRKKDLPEIRDLVGKFFSPFSSEKRSMFFDPEYLEHYVLTDHLAKKQGTYFDRYKGTIPSRDIFKTLITAIAKDGHWYDVDKLALHILYTAADEFTYGREDYCYRVSVKADALDIDGYQPILPMEEEYYPIAYLGYLLLQRPLLRAYCYLFGALGILELSESPPGMGKKRKDKLSPVTPYDSLKAVRVTPFGRYCLGFSSRPPARKTAEYEAIADKELLLVTVQGVNLERSLYLDQIGRKLGEMRWRISPESFIRGCTHSRHIEERIARFKKIIDPNPAPHWEALFSEVLKRAGAFDVPEDMAVYRLPSDPAFTSELLGDRVLRKYLFRAEGGFIMVPRRNRRKFAAILAEHGVLFGNDGG